MFGDLLGLRPEADNDPLNRLHCCALLVHVSLDVPHCELTDLLVIMVHLEVQDQPELVPELVINHPS